MKRTVPDGLGSIVCLMLLNAVRPAAAACVTPTAVCAEYFHVRNGPARVLIYRSHSLAIPDREITHAIIAIHGAERDAATSFRIAAAAAVLSGRPESTLVLAPRFATRIGPACADDVAVDELTWQCDVQLRDWRMGGAALSDVTLASFDVIDELLTAVEDVGRFPNLRTVVVVGHSAGGQFVTNYQMTNRVHERLRVPPTYVAANASAYAYPDDTRPTVVDLTACPTYADWPFGVGARVGYVSRPLLEEIRDHAAQRPITLLMGELDNKPATGGFFASCAALAQGASTRERGEAFGRHMSARYKARQTAVVVPGCGHSESCMFLSRPGMTALFFSAR